MNLNEPSPLNRAAKAAAPLLSSVMTHPLLSRLSLAADAYFNFLLGRGSGTGWDLASEVACAANTLGRDHAVIFDVGANRGEWSMMMQQLKPDSRVYMFEPSPDCQAILSSRGELKASLRPVGLSETAGSAQLYSSGPTDGSASLHERGETYFSHLDYKPVSVSLSTVDHEVEALGIDRIDFMKLDVEGHELSVLKGAKNTLKSRRINALAFEFGSGNINSRTFFRDFWDLLNEAGFAISRITPCGRLLPIQTYYEDLEYFRGVSNYLAVLK
ncbi:MAG: FkbM family methyltransferase [Verrucomicrobiaceae bacterium]|nr:FkbM family methyltransferase [Verrucomicrobiaceae bacterium]